MSAKTHEKKEVEVVKNETTLKLVENKNTAEKEKKEVIPNVLKAQQEKEIERLLNPTAEQRLKSLEQMQILGEKFKFLTVKQDELNKFILSSDGTKEKISLSNHSGFHFEVSNSQTIEKIVKIISDDLMLFTERAEKEILMFTV